MKKIKKQIISLLIILSILSTSVLAIDVDITHNKDIDELFNYFPKLFYEDLDILKLLEDKNKISEDFKNILSFKEDFISQSTWDINNYIYYYDLDNFSDLEIFFSDNNLNTDNGFNIPFENKNEFISNYYNKNYLKVYMKDNALNVEGINTFAQSWTMVFYDNEGNKINPNFLTTMPISNNRFQKSFKLFNLENLKSLTISLNTHKLDKYYPSDYNFVFSEDMKFEEPVTFKANKEVHMAGYSLEPNDFLSLEHIDNNHRDVIYDKAIEITKDLDTDYEKVLAIHKWVSNNIFYDFDSLTYNKRGPNDAYHTYMDKKAVCQGYAELSLALCRSIGIPTKLIYGYALGVVSGEESWNETSLSEDSNHAWNEAFIDGRWIIFDTTWDSSNRYEKGNFNESKGKLRYFDPSLKAFSQTHRILNIVDI